MPYVKETFRAEGVIEVKRYHSYRWGGKKTRAANRERTEEAVARGNQKRAREKLYRLLATNFRRDDIRVDLTYRDPPPEPEAAVKRVQKFLRDLRKLYRKKGKELRYIYVTEYHGHRVHHHLIIPAGISRSEANSLWPYAELNYRSWRLYDGRPEDAEALATYLIKETSLNIREGVQKVRWVGSRNLKKPDVKKTIIHSRHWREKPAPPKNFFIQDIVNEYTDEGYPYQWYRAVELEKGGGV